jgi:uncharacterized protein (TIGR03067 family)
MISMAGTNRMGMRAFATGLTAFLTLAVWAVHSPGGSDDDKTSSEALKALQGTWVTAEDQGLDSKWTFEGETLKASVNGTDYTCKVKIEPKAKPHATMDLVIDEGPEDSKGKTSKCIYKFAGEKLTLCVSVPGKDRPKEFEQAEDESYVFQLKKELKKDEPKKDEPKKDEPKKGAE